MSSLQARNKARWRRLSTVAKGLSVPPEKALSLLQALSERGLCRLASFNTLNGEPLWGACSVVGSLPTLEAEAVPSAIFISYRRTTSDIAYRIYQLLGVHFGSDRVWIDVAIPSGASFADALAEARKNCEVMLAVIGPDWLASRIQSEDDFVRQEIEFALGRNIPLIPVLIGDAAMPTTNQLPKSLHKLTEFQAIRLSSGRDFTADVASLTETIESRLRRQRAQKQPNTA